jgi:hypothetical protein
VAHVLGDLLHGDAGFRHPDRRRVTEDVGAELDAVRALSSRRLFLIDLMDLRFHSTTSAIQPAPVGGDARSLGNAGGTN